MSGTDVEAAPCLQGKRIRAVRPSCRGIHRLYTGAFATRGRTLFHTVARQVFHLRTIVGNNFYYAEHVYIL
jgi:hypothetical protein